MNEKDMKKLISRTFAQMKRKSFEYPKKEALWLRIQSQINRDTADEAIQATAFKHTALSPLFLLRSIWAKAGAAVLIVIMAVFVASGAANATPGETLYTVKKAAEQVEEVIAIGDEANVKVQVKHAKRRIAEVKTLVAENQDEQIIKETLAELQSKTNEVIQATVRKPELKNHAAELARELDGEILKNDSSVTARTRAALDSTFAETRKSIDKLLGEKNGDVKGAASDNGNSAATAADNTTATSTDSGQVKSDIQVDKILEGDGGEKTDDEQPDDEPIILDEPTKEF